MGEIILSDFFTTKSQANDFSLSLSAISEEIFNIGFDLNKALLKEFGTHKRDKFIELLRENNISTISGSSINSFIGQIQNTIKSLPQVSIVLAIDPKEEILKAISEWFILNVKKQVLLEITIDPEIIAGAIAGYKGRQFDASIKNEFENIFVETLTTNIA